MANNDAIKLFMDEDTFVDASKPEQSFSAAHFTVVKDGENTGYDRSSYFKTNFNVIDNNVESAILHFHVDNSATAPITIYGLADDTWDETTLSYVNQPNNEDVTELGTVQVANVGWYKLDVSEYVKEQSVDQIVTFKLSDKSETKEYIKISSSNSSSNHPHLMVITEPPVIITNISVTDDAYVDDGKPDKNFNASNTLIIKDTSGNDRKAYLKANLDEGKFLTIEKVDFSFYNKNAISETPLSVYIFPDNSWTANQLTANNQPDITGEQYLGSVNVSDVGWYSINIPSNLYTNSEDGTMSFKLLDESQNSTYMKLESMSGSNKPGLQVTGQLIEEVITPYPELSLGRYNVTEDTAVSDLALNANYGSSSKLMVGNDGVNEEKAYFKSDFSAFNANIVGSARFTFYNSTDSSNQPTKLNLYGLNDDSWDSGLVVSGAEPSSSGEVFLGSVVISHPGWYSFDVTGYIASQVIDKMATFKLEAADTLGLSLAINSSEDTYYHPNLNVLNETEQDEFDLLRKSKSLKYTYDTTDTDIIAAVATLTSEAQILWDNMDKSTDRTFLWSENPGDDSGDISVSLGNLYILTKEYLRPESPFYNNSALLNDIVDGTLWVHEHWYNSYTIEFSNWYPFELGAPKNIASILLALPEHFSVQQKRDLVYTIYHFQPHPAYSGAIDPNRAKRPSVGANRADTVKIAMYFGMLSENSDSLFAARDALTPVFDYTTRTAPLDNTEDGFFQDGSYVQHFKIAYTAGYGQVLLANVSIINWLKNTSWEFYIPSFNNVYDWVINSFEPIMYKGLAMDMVRGRKIASLSSDQRTGFGIINAVNSLSVSAPQAYKTKFQGMVKEWLINSTIDYADGTHSPSQISKYKGLIGDDTVSARGGLSKHVVFANMDRTVHHSNGWAFGLSMYSERIANYESLVTVPQNVKGWYTGQGMGYIYNNDVNHYSDVYWPTVDMYRLPGTTVDTIIKADKDGNNQLASTKFAGGTMIHNQYGVSGMDLAQYETSLVAKKSYFMFDDEIVHLGAGISSVDNRVIESIIENRRLNDSGDNALTVDGILKPNSLSWSETVNSATWAHLAGTMTGSDIGYYFPNSSNVHMLREARTGSYADIDWNGLPDLMTSNYVTMYIDHGANPLAATYQYVTLPNKTPEQVASYATSPDITVLSNNELVQAVKEKKLNIVGANFFSNTIQSIDIITSSNIASVMTQEVEGISIDIAVSDPTHANSGVINIEIDKAATGLLSSSAEITVIQLSPTIKLQIDVNASAGATFIAKFDLTTL
jgi:hyaluronate lyase